MTVATPVGREDWRLHARCRGMDIAVFYSGDDYHHSQRRQEQVAKTICRQCPVITECRECAIHFGEQHGIWGGLNPRELRAARKWSRWDRQPTQCVHE
ncbi:WhiB family transcriptional regulator [Rhodococcus sp. WB9]|uniref:WhiB family transcriptional regulator n=1 Tax=Rhodococcus sp. WB9 TaxID=2594007 RepID=UPI0011865F57|nr:WhiB family transcriptional regulator [Rhodococcus sp. WB9]QDQ95069.1 WhiB family transcriptional regulator [Rhodococcus sp. WB9]